MEWKNNRKNWGVSSCRSVNDRVRLEYNEE